MTTRELIAELRSRINPLYAAQMGTESYERRLCVEALEAQADRLEALKPIAWRYTDAFGTHFTDDRREVFNVPGVETWTALYGEERHGNT